VSAENVTAAEIGFDLFNRLSKGEKPGDNAIVEMVDQLFLADGKTAVDALAYVMIAHGCLAGTLGLVTDEDSEEASQIKRLVSYAYAFLGRAADALEIETGIARDAFDGSVGNIN
jgi:hypothetical protein